MKTLAILRLRSKLLFANAMLWVASSGTDVEPKPETHLYLADLHFRLAFAYDAAGKRKLAKRHRVLGNRHAAKGPPAPLPPAVAMAMPVPDASESDDIA